MTEFGKQLRKFRHQCNDPKSPHGKLTQGKFGEFAGRELGVSYSGAAVSDWERGISRIHADDRLVLIAVLKTLQEYGGLRTVEEANQLLEAGNYRAINTEEFRVIFGKLPPESTIQQPVSEQKPSKSSALFYIGSLFSIPEDELQKLISEAEEGPPPAWPRVIVSVVRRFSDRISVSTTLKFILWVWVWLLTSAFIMPSLHWPFSDRENALFAIHIYALGSILIPALISTLTNTNDNEFWRMQQGVSTLNLRLYTHQGASIGFHVGYFFVFMIGLLLYNLGWQSVAWAELAAAVFLVALGYGGARLVPYNIFKAYDELSLKAGRIFFIFFLVGPAWGYFFSETYELLLTRSLGIFIVLSSLTILLAMMTLRYRQSGTTVIPVHWWVIFWVSFLLCQLLLLWLTQVT